jgi:hypothetical protein
MLRSHGLLSAHGSSQLTYFERQVQSSFGRLAAHKGGPFLASALDEAPELKSQRFILGDWHRLAHDPASGKLAYDCRFLRVQELLEQ